MNRVLWLLTLWTDPGISNLAALKILSARRRVFPGLRWRDGTSSNQLGAYRNPIPASISIALVSVRVAPIYFIRSTTRCLSELCVWLLATWLLWFVAEDLGWSLLRNSRVTKSLPEKGHRWVRYRAGQSTRGGLVLVQVFTILKIAEGTQ